MQTLLVLLSKSLSHSQSLHSVQLATLEYDLHFSTYARMVAVRINDGKALNGLSGFVVCFCFYVRNSTCVYRFLSSTSFCKRMATSHKRSCMQRLLTDQTVLDFQRVDISFITEQQL